jgi:glycosyltransferase involved in cell wall biosynthesis
MAKQVRPAGSVVTNGDHDRPLRCLWLTKGLGRGGVERLLLDMYPLMDREAFEVDVAYVLPWKDNYHRPLAELGAGVHCVGQPAGTADPRWVARLGRLVARGDYDLIHTHAPVPAVAARLVSLRPGGPAIIHTEHNMWERYRTPTRLLNSLTYWRNAGVIAVSGVVEDSIRPWPGGRGRVPVRTVHHGTVLDSIRSFDVAERLERRSAEGLPTDRFLIGNVGNFTRKKDHRNLLRAMAGDGPVSRAHLVLIGLGPLEQELRDAVAELGLDGRVTFLGSRGDVFELLPLLDLFCLSSEFEGFPIALVEAMATGLPCVATAVGGIPEIVTDGESGLLVPPRDPEALRRAIERVMADPDGAGALATRAREEAARLDLRHAVGQLQELYLEAVATG